MGRQRGPGWVLAESSRNVRQPGDTLRASPDADAAGDEPSDPCLNADMARPALPVQKEQAPERPLTLAGGPLSRRPGRLGSSARCGRWPQGPLGPPARQVLSRGRGPGAMAGAVEPRPATQGSQAAEGPALNYPEAMTRNVSQKCQETRQSRGSASLSACPR
jgi:hypothetical protein